MEAPACRRARLPGTLVAISFLAYVVYWSTITILRYYALNAYVFDLGIFMQNGWVVLHQVHTLAEFLSYFAYNGIIYLVSPLTLLNSYPAILIFQSVVIALAVFPLYRIAVYFLGERLPAALIAVSYLLYFPLAGVNWYDAHYQAVFPTLFIFAYYFYLKGRFAPSAALFMLSALVRFPYLIFPLGFSGMVLGGEIVAAFRGRRGVDWRRLRFAAVVIAFCALMVVLYYIFVMNSSLILQGPLLKSTLGSVNGAQLQSPFVDVQTKAFTVLLFLAPLFFTTLLSRRWAPFLLPYLFLLFGTSFAGYRFPAVFELQYPAGVVPFIYLGAIEGMALLLNRGGIRLLNRREGGSAAGLGGHLVAAKGILGRLSSHVNQRRAVVLAAGALVVVASFAVAFEPYGPLNGYTPDNFRVSYSTAVNLSLYDELVKMASLIPSTNPYVLLQNNMPELLPRPLAYVPSSTPFNQFPLMPSSVSSSLNYGRLPNGTQIPATIDYVITDPYSDQYYYQYLPAPYNASMYYLVRELYSSGSYGILAEASGMVLLERGYTGSLMYYVPLDLNFTPGQLYVRGGTFKGQVIEATNFSGLIWYGPYTSLSPGNYSLTFWLYTTSSLPSNELQLQVTADQGGTKIVSMNVTGSQMQPDAWTAITIPLNVTGFYGLVEFRGVSLQWSGSILLQTISLRQIGPG